VIQYQVTNEELIDFARKIYEEACSGYLDLKDSACDQMVRDFINLPHRKIAKSENNWHVVSTDTNLNWHVDESNTISLRDDTSVLPRVQDTVRINYEGNESERF